MTATFVLKSPASNILNSLLLSSCMINRSRVGFETREVSRGAGSITQDWLRTCNPRFTRPSVSGETMALFRAPIKSKTVVEGQAKYYLISVDVRRVPKAGDRVFRAAQGPPREDNTSIIKFCTYRASETSRRDPDYWMDRRKSRIVRSPTTCCIIKP